MNDEEIGTFEKDGNIILSSVCIARKEKNIANGFNKVIGFINKSTNKNNAVDVERNNINMNHTIITTDYNKTFETTDNGEIYFDNITISSIGE